MDFGCALQMFTHTSQRMSNELNSFASSCAWIFKLERLKLSWRYSTAPSTAYSLLHPCKHILYHLVSKLYFVKLQQISLFSAFSHPEYVDSYSFVHYSTGVHSLLAITTMFACQGFPWGNCHVAIQKGRRASFLSHLHFMAKQSPPTSPSLPGFLVWWRLWC